MGRSPASGNSGERGAPGLCGAFEFLKGPPSCFVIPFEDRETITPCWSDESLRAPRGPPLRYDFVLLLWRGKAPGRPSAGFDWESHAANPKWQLRQYSS